MNCKTKPAEIIAYWLERVYEGDMGVDWCDADARCWRCGTAHSSPLQRCHIIPACEPFLGKDEPSNLVLLCARCHAEAPSCTDSSAMWAWIKRTSKPLYDTFWAYRFMEQYASEVGETFETTMKNEGINEEELACLLTKVFCENLENCGFHFCGMNGGQSGISAASKVWALKNSFAMLRSHAAQLDWLAQ